MRLIVHLTFLMFGLSSLAAAQDSLTVNVTTAVENWEISGRNERELIADINSDLSFRTTYMFDVQAYPFFDQRVGEGCWLEGGSVNVHTTVSVPVWVDYDDARRNLRRRWDRYIENLEAYNEGHLEISRQGAAIIAQRLEALPRRETCAETMAAFDELLDSLIESLNVSHRDYVRVSGGVPRITTPLPIRD